MRGLTCCTLLALLGACLPLVPACRIRRLDNERSLGAASAFSSASIGSSSAAPLDVPAASPSGTAASSTMDEDSGFRLEPAIIAALGVGTNNDDLDGVKITVEAAREALTSHGALDAVVEGMSALENSPSFRASRSAQIAEIMAIADATISGPGCWFASAAFQKHVHSAIALARLLCNAPQSIVAGPGALAWARGAKGLTELPSASANTSSSTAPRSPDASVGALEWTPWEWLVGDPRHDAGINDATAPDEDARLTREAAGPAAVLVRDGTGAFAGALSGIVYEQALAGRVTDVSIPGAALFVGDRGGVAISGVHAHLDRHGLARSVYANLIEGRSAHDAAEWGITHLEEGAHVGIVVIDANSIAARSNIEMAWAGWSRGLSFSTAAKPVRPPSASTSSEAVTP